MSQTVDQTGRSGSTESSPSSTSDATPNSLDESTKLISIPRWVVYFQAALLGIIATTFFIFGMMVGNLTSSSSREVNPNFDCRVVGSVAFRENGDLQADEGAVVFLLPKNEKPDERFPGESVNPGSFKALDNSAIDRIHELGGAVVRADQNGQFDVMIDANIAGGIEYYLIIVSNNVRGEDTEPMTKEQVAAVGTYFIPVEDVVDDRSFYWLKLSAETERIDLPEIEF